MMKSSRRIDQALNKAKRKCKGIKSGFTKDTKVMHEDISAQIQIKQQPVQIEKKTDTEVKYSTYGNGCSCSGERPT
jgi:hypothetical protein